MLIRILFIITAWLAGAWDLMVTVGIAHDEWWRIIPLMGFGSALAIVTPVMVIYFIIGVIQGLLGDD